MVETLSDLPPQAPKASAERETTTARITGDVRSSKLVMTKRLPTCYRHSAAAGRRKEARFQASVVSIVNTSRDR
jgi:hypothetical protein